MILCPSLSHLFVSLERVTCCCARLFFCCFCFGTMPPLFPLFPSISSGLPSGVLLLVCLLLLLPSVSATCAVCFGNAVGCGGDSANCPWVTGVATNVTLVAAATGGLLKIQKLLPAKFVRLFPRAAIDALTGLVTKVKTAGTAFDPTDKSVKDITGAVKGGQLTKD